MTIETELLALKNADGFIVAETAVDWAREHPSSDLHNHLEWNDRVAGREYRIWQVRQLIRIHVVAEDGTPNLVSLSIDRTRPQGGYRELNDVLREKTLYDILLQDCLNELERTRRKYERIRDLQPVWKAIEKVAKKRGKKAGREQARARV